MTPTKMAEIAANELEGTCKSIADLGSEYVELLNNIEFCDTLDGLVFECKCCEWWFEVAEMDEDQDDWICVECGKEL